MGLLFGRVNIDDKDLHAIGVMVEEACSALKALAAAGHAIAKAIEAVASAFSRKKMRAFWGLLKVE